MGPPTFLRHLALLALFAYLPNPVIAWDEGDCGDCSSPFWSLVQAVLAGERFPGFPLTREGGPTNSTLKRLEWEERAAKTVGHYTDCKVGKLLLSLWHTTRTTGRPTERELGGIEAGLARTRSWVACPGWQPFRALSKLRSGLVAASEPSVSSSSSSSSSSSHYFPSSSSFSSSHSPYTSGSTASATPRKPAARGQSVEAPAESDPRNPSCPTPPSMPELVAGLEHQNVEAIVVYGRKDRTQILNRYLQRNLKRNGGLLHRVHFVVYFTPSQEDATYLDELILANAPDYDMPPVYGRRLAKIYSICTDPETIYIKIDDDIVYLADEAIPSLVRERRRGRCGMVSANVVNHAILSAVHQDIGAIRTLYPSPDGGQASQNSVLKDWRWSSWEEVDHSLAMMPIERKAQSQCVWSMWECAAWMHEAFLQRLAEGTDCAFDFRWHDFHAAGFGTTAGNRFRPMPHTRWSINFFAFTVADLEPADLEYLAEDDEAELSVTVPNRMQKRSCAVGRAIVAHFSYSRQEDGIMENTNLLARYDALSREWMHAAHVPMRSA